VHIAPAAGETSVEASIDDLVAFVAYVAKRRQVRRSTPGSYGVFAEGRDFEFPANPGPTD
jgi:hypothetical protein